MNNDHLVDLVRTSEFYLMFKSPRDERVLEAMKKTDRRDFIPSQPDAVMTLVPTEVRLMGASINLLSQKLKEDKESDYSDLTLTTIERVMHVFQTRKEFLIDLRDLAYNDEVLPIGYSQTCSQPSMVAFMDDVLELEDGMKVLEIGSGCGYHAAVTLHLIEPTGTLVTVEYIPELKEIAEDNLKKHFEDRFKVIQGDGSIGLESEAPFDRIYLTAGINPDSFDPLILARQLKPEGILLYPEQKGAIIKQTYDNGNLTDKQSFNGVVFVPLKGQNT